MLTNLSKNSLLLPDVEQEIMAPGIREFQRKILSTIPVDTTISIIDQLPPVCITEYLVSMGILPARRSSICLGSSDTLHNLVLENLEKIRSNIEGSNIDTLLPYKATELSQEIALALGLKLDSSFENVDYLSSKDNLYEIFPAEMLPKIYTFDGNEFMDSQSGRILEDSKKIILKSKQSASCKGIYLVDIESAKYKFRSGELDLEEFVFQEFIDTLDAYSVTYVSSDDGSIHEVYDSEQIIENQGSGFKYIANKLDIKNSSLTEGARRRILRSVSSNPMFRHVKVFNIDYLIYEGRPIIMEVNARFPGSLIPAAGLDRLGVLNNIKSGRDVRTYFSASKKTTLTIEEAFGCISEKNLIYSTGSTSEISFLPLCYYSYQDQGSTVNKFDYVLVTNDENQFRVYEDFDVLIDEL